jgi:hypothetical protein
MMDIVKVIDAKRIPVSGTREPTDISSIPPTLSLTPRSSELRSHSQTIPYLRREPAKFITNEAEKRKFLDLIFPVNGASTQQDIELGHLRYDSAQPRKAEGLVSKMFNGVISPSSRSASSSLN